MTSHQLVGKMDTRKLLNVSLYTRLRGEPALGREGPPRVGGELGEHLGLRMFSGEGRGGGVLRVASLVLKTILLLGEVGVGDVIGLVILEGIARSCEEQTASRNNPKSRLVRHCSPLDSLLPQTPTSPTMTRTISMSEPKVAQQTFSVHSNPQS